MLTSMKSHAFFTELQQPEQVIHYITHNLNHMQLHSGHTQAPYTMVTTFTLDM